MLYLLLLPVYIAANIYFLREMYIWIEAIFKLAKNERRKRLIKAIKISFTVLYSVCSLSLLIAFIIPDKLMQSYPVWKHIRRVFKLIGNYHEGVLIYLLFAFLVAELVRHIYFIIMKVRKLKPRLIPIRRAITGLIVTAFIVTASLMGVFKARVIYDTKYDIDVTKGVRNPEDLRIVLVADLHIGYNIGALQMTNMVNKINAENPDLVVVAGDIFDNEYEAIENPDEIINILSGIKSKYGVYAVYGNHDIEEPILGGFTFGDNHDKGSSKEMDEFIEASGMTLLRDEGLMINDSVYLYGRPDYRRPGNGITERKTPEEICTKDYTKEPSPCAVPCAVVVIDHEPRELEELAEAGVDIDLCGHTHDGQIFPLNLTSRYLTWENSCGYLKVGNMHNIVTSGVGLFGPNMRVGTKAEICTIDVHLK